MAFNGKNKNKNKIVKRITENRPDILIFMWLARSYKKDNKTNKTKAKTKIRRNFELFCLVIYRAPSHGGPEINSTKKTVINTETQKEEK